MSDLNHASDLHMDSITDSGYLLVNHEEPENQYIYSDDEKELLRSKLGGIKLKNRELYSQLLENIVFVEVEYVPYTDDPNVLKDRGDELMLLNSHISPRKVHALTDQPELPNVYGVFFRYMFPDKKSREFVLDFMAQSMREKVMTYLVLVAGEGVGKGTLATILTMLHLPENTGLMNNDSLASNFNVEMVSRTLLVADEIKARSKSAMDKLKLLINEVMSVEAKFKNRTDIQNYANIVIQSNNHDCLSIGENSRRFSVPDITDVSMCDWVRPDGKPMSIKNLRKQLFDPKNISLLFSYLHQRDVTREFNKPFKGNTFLDMLAGGMNEWEELVLDYVGAQDEPVEVHDILDHVKSKKPSINLSLGKIIALFKERYNGSYTVLKNGRQGTTHIHKNIKVTEGDNDE